MNDRPHDPPFGHVDRDGLEPGVYEDVPDDEYHDEPSLSSTLVRRITTSIDHYCDRLDGDGPSGAHIDLGTYGHVATLEPDRWEREFVGYPEPPEETEGLSDSKRTVAQELADDPTQQAEPIAEAAGVQPSTVEKWRSRDDITALADHIREHGPAPDPELVETAQKIADRVRSHPKIRGGLLDEGRAETTVVWDDGDVRSRARPDFLRPYRGGRLLVDLKTTSRDLGWWRRRGIWQREIHVQLAHYRAGVEAHIGDVAHALTIVVESEPPHDVAVFGLGADALEAGEELRQDALRTLREWWESPDGWTGQKREIEFVECPQWAKL